MFTTLLAFALITFVGEVPALGGTTALLLLCVFTVVNIAVLVLRKDTVGHKHFRTPTFLPMLGAICVRVPRRPVDGPRSGAVPDRRRADRHRRRALVRDGGGEPIDRRAAGEPEMEDIGGIGAEELSPKRSA